MKKLGLIAFLLPLALASCGALPDDEFVDPTAGRKNYEIVGLDTTDLYGKSVTQSFFSGKITLINVWATYCEPCKAEMPALEKYSKMYADKDFQVLGICADYYSDATKPAQALSIYANLHLTYTSIVPCIATTKIINKATAVPYSVFVDSDCVAIGSPFVGSLSDASWNAKIKTVLGL